MPRVTVSYQTHERISKQAIWRLDLRETTFNPNGTVTFFLNRLTINRLKKISPDIEVAINRAIDVYENKDTRN